MQSLKEENTANIENSIDNSEIEEIVKKIERIKTHKNDESEDCTKKR